MLSVFLGNEEIYAVWGDARGKNITVKNAVKAKLSAGCILNGVITNEDGLFYDISQFWKINNLPKKDIQLVINSARFTMRRFTLPNISSKKMAELVKMELSDNEKTEPVYDYMLLEKNPKAKKQAEVLGVVCDEAFIGSYVNLFKRLGIRLCAITGEVISTVKLIHFGNSVLNKETAIIQTIDGNNLLSFIFKEGEYIYSQRTRLFSAKGSDDFIREIAGTVSRLRQFHLSTQKKDINKVYFDGSIDREVLDGLNSALKIYDTGAEYIHGFKGISFEGGRHIRDYLFCTGSFLSISKDINFYGEYSKIIKKRRKKGLLRLHGGIYAAAGGAFACIIALWLVFCVSNIFIENKIKSINDFLTAPENANAAAMAEEASGDNAELKNSAEALKNAISAIKTYPVYSSSVRNRIFSCEDSGTKIAINKIDLENGIIRLEARCAGAEAASEVAERLEATGLFLPPDYKGKTLDSETGEFIVNIECILKERSELPN